MMPFRMHALCVAIAVGVAACGSSSVAPAPTSHPGCAAAATFTPRVARGADPVDLAPYAGIYTTASGVTYLLTRSGLMARASDGAVNAISVDHPGRLDVGANFSMATPAQATLSFTGPVEPGGKPSGFILQPASGRCVVATRLATTQQDETIPNGDVKLAATLTRPPGNGLLPAVVIVHGSGVETRAVLDLWTQLYASLGFAVLTFDKRGAGQSTGRFPGGFASDTTLNLLATDVEAVVAYLRSLPGIAPSRIGLHAGSQGGWTAAIAAATAHPAFDVIASGPPLTVDQQGLWSELTGNGDHPASPAPDVDAQLANAHSGFDPMPLWQRDTMPALWLLGEDDLHVPTRLAVSNLTALHRTNVTWKVLPGCSHQLLRTGTGLDRDDATATTFSPELFADIADFLQSQR